MLERRWNKCLQMHGDYFVCILTYTWHLLLQLLGSLFCTELHYSLIIPFSLSKSFLFSQHFILMIERPKSSK